MTKKIYKFNWRFQKLYFHCGICVKSKETEIGVCYRHFKKLRKQGVPFKWELERRTSGQKNENFES